MSKPGIVLASAISLLLLASCGSQDPATSENVAVDPADTIQNSAPPDPGRAGPPGDDAAETVPPPDAVSHPDGYLPDAADAPPARPEPEADPPSDPKASPPATEDEYLRNKQGGG